MTNNITGIMLEKPIFFGVLALLVIYWIGFDLMFLVSIIGIALFILFIYPIVTDLLKDKDPNKYSNKKWDKQDQYSDSKSVFKGSGKGVFCNSCGDIVDEEDQFCMNCGSLVVS